jgi:16S rRNA (guanine527-N7)-methyltransferase
MMSSVPLTDSIPFSDHHELMAAVDAFGTALPTAHAYALLLADQGVSWGILGPREVGRLWGRHLINSAAVAPLVPVRANVIDVGSGAGLPGLPLRLARPDVRVTLLEPSQRRIRFLELCLRELRLADVTLVASRAEQLDIGVSADVVTARAVAPLPRLLAAAWQLVRPGGQLLAVKGRRAEQDLASCVVLPTDLAAEPDVVRRCGADGDPLVTVVRFRRAS